MGKLLRSHRERAAPAHRMADHECVRERHALADHLEGRAREYDDAAALMKQLMRGGDVGAWPTREHAEEGIVNYAGEET